MVFHGKNKIKLSKKNIITMSESNTTFAIMGKLQTALAEEITKNAWRIAGSMTVGLVIEIDGKRIPMEHQILNELNEEVSKKICG